MRNVAVDVIGALIESEKVSTAPGLLPESVIAQKGLKPEGNSLLNCGFTQIVPALRLNFNTVFGQKCVKRKKRDVKLYSQMNLDAYLSTDVSRRVVKPGRRIRAQPEPM